MARWTFEPGHTAAEFRARHMMVTYVRGAFKNVHGTLEFDPESPRLSSVQATIEATGIWTGEPKRDAHLRSPDFLDVENFPQITFKGDQVELRGDHDYVVTGELTIRGVTRSVSLTVSYLGQWQTPWWEEEGGEWVDKGPRLRAGFMATTEINRHDFGVSWSDTMDRAGVVVGEQPPCTLNLASSWPFANLCLLPSAAPASNEAPRRGQDNQSTPPDAGRQEVNDAAEYLSELSWRLRGSVQVL